MPNEIAADRAFLDGTADFVSRKKVSPFSRKKCKINVQSQIGRRAFLPSKYYKKKKKRKEEAPRKMPEAAVWNYFQDWGHLHLTNHIVNCLSYNMSYMTPLLSAMPYLATYYIIYIISLPHIIVIYEREKKLIWGILEMTERWISQILGSFLH